MSSWTNNVQVGRLVFVRSLRAVLVISGVIAGVAACGTMLGLEEYEIVPSSVDSGASPADSDASPDAASCWRPDGFPGGKPCFACDATTTLELLNACTSRPCVPFDDFKRISGFDGSPPPPPDGSIDEVAPPSDAVAADTAGAADACADIPNHVYVTGSTAFELLMPGLGAALSRAEPPINLVYLPQPSCDGLKAITANTPLFGTAKSFRGGVAGSCRLSGEVADIGLCDVYADRCIPGFAGVPGVKDFLGPNQVFMFAVPGASTQTAISRNAAYMVFGFASMSGVSPWDDPSHILRRHPGSGTQQFIAAAIGLPVDVWRGTRIGSSSAMFPTLIALPSPEKAIGITSADVTDDFAKRPQIPPLAYQHAGQNCAFPPDTTKAHWDKSNVRDGHYYLWAPVHMFVHTTAGAPSVNVNTFINVVRGASSLMPDLVAQLKRAGLVPTCAMRVTRTEGGELRPEEPEFPCHCAYEAAAPASDVKCKSCARDDECAPGKCRFGFCEAR